ncbi:hypothetical protein CR513_55034, partial [Mucuna pruriens]
SLILTNHICILAGVILGEIFVTDVGLTRTASPVGKVREGRRRHVGTWPDLKREMRLRYGSGLLKANVLKSNEVTVAQFLHGLNREIQDMKGEKYKRGSFLAWDWKEKVVPKTRILRSKVVALNALNIWEKGTSRAPTKGRR